MFGVLVPGRRPETSFQQLESNKFLLTIPNSEPLNHVAVFLTGVMALPPSHASCIFFSLPDPSAPPSWHYLGYLTNEKPSALFKLSNLTTSRSMQGHGFNYTQGPVVNFAQIGVSVEPIEAAMQMVPAVETAASRLNTFNEFTTKTVTNLFNYCSSFSKSASEIASNQFMHMNQFVPLSILQTWHENYTRRLNNDPNFWRSLN